MAEGVQMQQRRDIEANWATSNYVLAAGEIGVALDTGIMKVGDGSNGWIDLDPLFANEYLSTLGTAANANLLDGMSSESFVQDTDLSTSPTPNSVPQRLSDGRIKAATAVDSDDVVPYDQTLLEITNSLPVGRRVTGSRLVTETFTVASSDIGKRISVNNSSTTNLVACNLPTNAADPIPAGSWVDIYCTGNGMVKIVPGGADVVRGSVYIYPLYDMVRLYRTSTLEWLSIPMGTRNSRNYPKATMIHSNAVNYVAGQHHGIQYISIDAATTLNPNSEFFTIPGTGLSTARRLIVNLTGEYEVQVNFRGSQNAAAMTTRIAKMVGDNSPGTTLAGTSGGPEQNVYWRGRITAGESIGATHYSETGTDQGQVDSTANAGGRNYFQIVRIGD